nr:preprotein translocase subunit YajC [Anaerolineae bacterium]
MRVDRSVNVDQQIVILIIGLVLLAAFMFWPQWQARRRRQKQMAELRVGDEVMTVGGIIGKLTYFNAEENRARIEIAPGIEMRVVLAAISRTLTSS